MARKSKRTQGGLSNVLAESCESLCCDEQKVLRRGVKRSETKDRRFSTIVGNTMYPQLTVSTYSSKLW